MGRSLRMGEMLSREKEEAIGRERGGVSGLSGRIAPTYLQLAMYHPNLPHLYPGRSLTPFRWLAAWK